MLFRSVENDTIPGSIELVKYMFNNDREGLGRLARADEVEFAISRTDGLLPTTYNTVRKTDGNGRVLFDNLPHGTYAIWETDLPYGFEAAYTEQNPLRLVVRAGLQNEYSYEAVSVINADVKGRVELLKRFVPAGQFTDNQVLGIAGEGEVVFKVSYFTPDQDPMIEQPTQHINPNRADGFWTTDANGYLILTNLEHGTYVVEEVETRYGFKMTTKTFVIPHDGTLGVYDDGPVIELAGNIDNVMQLADVILTKSIDRTILGDEEALLRGITFTIAGTNGNVLPQGYAATKALTVQQNANGYTAEVRFDELPHGTYVITENAPVGYSSNWTGFQKNFDLIGDAGFTLNQETGRHELVDEVLNIRNKYDITINKQNSIGGKQAGIRFGLFDETGTTALDSQVTDADGAAVFKDLDFEVNYLIREYTEPNVLPRTIDGNGQLGAAWKLNGYNFTQLRYEYDLIVELKAGGAVVNVRNTQDSGDDGTPPPDDGGGGTTTPSTTQPGGSGTTTIPGGGSGTTTQPGGTGSTGDGQDDNDIGDDDLPFGPIDVPPAVVPDKPEQDVPTEDIDDGEVPGGPVSMPKTGQAAAAQAMMGFGAVMAGLALILKKKKK